MFRTAIVASSSGGGRLRLSLGVSFGARRISCSSNFSTTGGANCFGFATNILNRTLIDDPRRLCNDTTSCTSRCREGVNDLKTQGRSVRFFTTNNRFNVAKSAKVVQQQQQRQGQGRSDGGSVMHFSATALSDVPPARSSTKKSANKISKGNSKSINTSDEINYSCINNGSNSNGSSIDAVEAINLKSALDKFKSLAQNRAVVMSPSNSNSDDNNKSSISNNYSNHLDNDTKVSSKSSKSKSSKSKGKRKSKDDVNANLLLGEIDRSSLSQLISDDIEASAAADVDMTAAQLESLGLDSDMDYKRSNAGVSSPPSPLGLLSKVRTQQSVWTVRRLYFYILDRLEEATSLSYGQGTASAEEDAHLLLLVALTTPSLDLSHPISDYFDDEVAKLDCERAIALASRRIELKEPMAYVVGKVVQQGCVFEVGPAVLIPRSFIGEILFNRKLWTYTRPEQHGIRDDEESKNRISNVDNNDDNIDEEEGRGRGGNNEISSSTSSSTFIVDSLRVKSVLDLCTGSACLAVLASKAFPNATRIDAIDISKDALEVAARNVSLHGLDKVINLYCGDLFAPLMASSSRENSNSNSSSNGDNKSNIISSNSSFTSDNSSEVLNVCQYDVILCNPPYVDNSGMSTLPAEYLKEPSLALDGGLDGLKLLKTILKDSERFLTDKGVLVVEVGRAGRSLRSIYPLSFPLATSNKAGKANKKKQQQSILLSRGENKKDNGMVARWLDTEMSNGEVFCMTKKALRHFNAKYNNGDQPSQPSSR